MEGVIRLLPYATSDGTGNMAADEALLQSAARGLASLRFYGWSEATVSLGYFQPAAVRLADPRLANLPWVRRPSGGATLVHHHELTYCLCLSAGALWHTGSPWMLRMHGILTAALTDLGLGGKIDALVGEPRKHGQFLCFQQHTPGDLLSGHSKIVGSAQRRHRQALMQHGSILIAQSEHTPDLPGLLEATGMSLTAIQVRAAAISAFERETGWRLIPDDWSDLEQRSIRELSISKYGSSAWNERR